MKGSGNRQPTVCIVDDDEAIREALKLLLFASDLNSCVFGSADEFLADPTPPAFDCMLLDIRMPGTDGLELFRKLQQQHVAYPIIFITGHGDIPLAVSAIKQGAFDFLTKPFREGELLEKIRAAIDHSRTTRQHQSRMQKLQERIDSCTPREQEVMRLLATGMSNKAAAESLGISPRTVEIHRAHLMQKMEADSLPALVRMLTLLDMDDSATS